MLQDREIAIDQFIKITAGGIQIADYDQIQAALIKRYKEVYGSDIDLANTTADGIFVNDLALIINNILQSFKVLYGNLDVDTASGVYLDALCRLSNVSRKTATHSKANLRITATQDTILYDNTTFVDSSGNSWVYNGPNLTILASAQTFTSITVTCTEYGPIIATAGSITQTLEASYLEVEQVEDAFVGEDDETDAELRARRAQSTGAAGTTVLESLVGSLLAVDGVDDVEIINNNTNDPIAANDGTEITEHSVYIIIRYAQGADITATQKTIGEIIYNKMTPGISTIEFNGSDGTSQSYVVVLGNNVTFLNQTIYWKKATPIHPTCSITITPGMFFAESTKTDIINAMIAYLNKLPLSKLPDKSNMIITATYADPGFKGAATYFVKDATLPSIIKNPNTYFNYTTGTATTSGNDIVITFA